MLLVERCCVTTAYRNQHVLSAIQWNIYTSERKSALRWNGKNVSRNFLGTIPSMLAISFCHYRSAARPRPFKTASKKWQKIAKSIFRLGNLKSATFPFATNNNCQWSAQYTSNSAARKERTNFMPFPLIEHSGAHTSHKHAGEHHFFACWHGKSFHFANYINHRSTSNASQLLLTSMCASADWHGLERRRPTVTTMWRKEVGRAAKRDDPIERQNPNYYARTPTHECARRLTGAHLNHVQRRKKIVLRITHSHGSPKDFVCIPFDFAFQC